MGEGDGTSSEDGRDYKTFAIPTPSKARIEVSKEIDTLVEVSPNEESRGCYATWQEFPKTVFAIFGNEFCERFSYYGMRTILTLYVVNILKFSDKTAFALFHGFVVLCYSSGIPGAIIADGYIGKFNTILWVSIFYSMGNVVLAVAATFDAGDFVHPWLDMIGLAIIGLGTGGIKPCVSPFGGDQFKKGQERLLETFFSVFYASINVGALISTFITPLIRASSCMGRDSCYPAAFGLPAALMVVSVVCFAIGAPWYKRFPPKENVIAEVMRCIFGAIRKKSLKKNKDIVRDHWLEHWLDGHKCEDDPKCTKKRCYQWQFVDDIKAFLRQCVMCVPMPVFWALYDQQGSVWVIQAVEMNGELWPGANLLPDQMTTLNAVLILVFIPIFQDMPKPSPMTLLLSPGKAFVVSFAAGYNADGEARLEKSQQGEGQFVMGLAYQTHTALDNYNGTFFWCRLDPKNPTTCFPKDASYFKAVNLTRGSVVTGTGWAELKPGTWHLYYPSSAAVNLTHGHWAWWIKNDWNKKAGLKVPGSVSLSDPQKRLLPTGLSFSVVDQGGIYMSAVASNGTAPVFTTLKIAERNTISILWQVPQYIVVTAAEILFSVTGLEFSYSQAPLTLKSAVGALWLLTNAAGDLLVLCIELANVFSNIAYEQLAYAVLMVAVMIVFMLLSIFWYEYGHFLQHDEDDEEEGDATELEDSVAFTAHKSKLHDQD